MKIHFFAVGRLKDEAERQIVARYAERFQHLAPQLGFGALTMVELPESKAKSARERKAAEAAELFRKLPEDAKVIALEEAGKSLPSTEFAACLAGWRDGGIRNLCIVIGGPDGFDPAFVEKAALTLSLGRLTMPHGLARAVIAEQLYRAATILARHPYHRD